MQIESMSDAQAALEQWHPIDQPSRMEETVLVRQHMLLGRVLRFVGRFDDSLLHLRKAMELTKHRDASFFDEDLRDLICDLADTLRELNDPFAAEDHLRNELKRRQRSCSPATGQASLQLSLAETLFAQHRLEEARALCTSVQSRPQLKFESLRLQIVLAKICHVESKFEDAFQCWNAALKMIRQYPMTNGRMTRVIVLSVCDALRHLGKAETADQSLIQVKTLEELASSASVQHWIAGTQHWLNFLDSTGRSHL